MQIGNLTLTVPYIYEILDTIMDPEIPTISIVDLGIVTQINILNSEVEVILTPTFSGCPALKIMEEMVCIALQKKDIPAKVKTTFDNPWNTNKISEKGLIALKKHGLAPPPKHNGYVELSVLSDIPCPLCESRNTTLQSIFGPTLCRSMHYCNNCLNGFEAFKPLD